MQNNSVVLAFSGGLDTSFCVPYLKNERNLEVRTVTVNTGGFSPEEAKALEEKALKLGAKSHVTIDATGTYYEKGIKYLIYGNVLKNDTYPLSVSSERIFQAIEVLKYARKIGASNVAHGSTGAGNDQVRFDIVFDILAPEIRLTAPIRELKPSRMEEVDYLKKHGFDFDWEKSKYSINQGLWGTSIGGRETLDSAGSLPEEAYPSQAVKSGKETVAIGFRHGEPVSIDGKEAAPVEIIRKINETAAPYGIGRDIHVGDTIIGIKGRVAFEAAAPLIIIKAHHLLEKHVLTKEQLYWKGELGQCYGRLMHEAQYLDPVMRNIEKFLDDAEKNVTGTVFVELRPYSFTATGIKSAYDMMQAGEYGEKSSFLTGEDIVGFTKVLANPMRIYYSLDKEAGGEAEKL